MNNSQTQATLNTRHRTKTNQTKNTTQKTKTMKTHTPPRGGGGGEVQMLAKGMQFLFNETLPT
jgi:hypothetical protein